MNCAHDLRSTDTLAWTDITYNSSAFLVSSHRAVFAASPLKNCATHSQMLAISWRRSRTCFGILWSNRTEAGATPGEFRYGAFVQIEKFRDGAGAQSLMGPETPVVTVRDGSECCARSSHSHRRRQECTYIFIIRGLCAGRPARSRR